MPEKAEFGFWKSPITSDLVAGESLRLGQIALSGEDIYWSEGRPAEGGRNVIVRLRPGGNPEDVQPPPFSARTRVHEYGGGAFVVDGETVYFSNDRDQRIYRSNPDAEPLPVTPEGPWRYADAAIDRARQRLICVREDHSEPSRECVNTLAAVDLTDGGATRVLVGGNDFYSNPVLNPTGTQLAWLTWNHPNMPWDGTELWLADLDAEGRPQDPSRIAGGAEESVFQPRWSPDGDLYYVSDPTGWWNLYRHTPDGPVPLAPIEVEVGSPQWVFGQSNYAFSSSHGVVFACAQSGLWRLGRVDPAGGEVRWIETRYTEISQLRASGDAAVFRGASAAEPPSIVALDLDTGDTRILRRGFEVEPDTAKHFSSARPIEFPTAGGLTAHAFYYAPRNTEHEPPEDELPPLIVKTHGGPTGATSSELSLETQYWTSRGFAVLDVNYGGSTGYGRSYRERLAGRWGIVDIDDSVHAAQYCVDQGWVDRERLIIKGGSAGGYTTLAALAFRDVFHAGASYYGVGDLEALARDTHKFESRYLDKLIGPYPESRRVYVERSPIHAVDNLSAPVIFFQGSEDKVVPLEQAEEMVAALRAKGVPAAYLLFDGEQHGFRRAETVRRCLDAELYFYSVMLLKKGLRF